MPESKQIGRLALRAEGPNWNAYYAMPNTMNGAIWLGSIKMTLVPEPSPRHAQFIDLMREAVADIIETTCGVRPTFPDGPQPAPEHEKAGHA